MSSGPASARGRLLRFGNRGIAFNLLLAGAAVVAAQLLLDPAKAVFQYHTPSTLVTACVVAAFLLEPFLLTRRFRDVCAHRNALGMDSLTGSNAGALLFSMLLFNAVVAFFALMLGARSLGFADESAAGVVGMLVTFRFLGMLFASLDAMDSRERLSARQALWTDVGVSAYTAVFYVCVWRVVVSYAAAGPPPVGALAAVGETLGLLLLALLWLLPMRFVYFLEEWWARPAGGGRAAYAATAGMLLAEVALVQLGRLLG